MHWQWQSVQATVSTNQKSNISFERLKELQEVVDIPLVIHGGTGVKDEDVKRVIDLGIRKFNVGTELLVGWNRKSRECYDEHHVKQ